MRRRQGFATAAMVLPATVRYAVTLIVPVGLALYLSLTNWDGHSASPAFVGGDNYAEVFADPDFTKAAVIMLLAAVVGTVLMNLLGLGFAVM